MNPFKQHELTILNNGSVIFATILSYIPFTWFTLLIEKLTIRTCPFVCYLNSLFLISMQYFSLIGAFFHMLIGS